MINFVDAGGVPNDSSASAQSANSTLIAELMDDTNIDSAASTPSGKERGGPHIYFPPGNYYFADAIRIKKTVHLEGSDAATRAGHQTAFLFPENKQGIIIDNDDTDNLTYVAKPNSNPGAAGTMIEGIMVRGSYSAPNDKHGILVRAYSILRHVGAQQFGGHGIYVLADLIPEHAIGGQASNSMILGCSAEGNAKTGLRIEGGDANIVNVIGGDYSFNGNWGIEDISFLGCTFSAIHMSGNNGGLGLAMHNGVPWVLRPGQDANAGSVQPGTNESVWTRYRGDYPSSSHPDDVAWRAARLWTQGKTTYRSGGAFITYADAARSVWTGCYTESGQSGAFLGKLAIAIGGDLGSGLFAVDLGGNGEAAFLEASSQEFVTRSSVRMKALYLGLTRNRGDRGFGMKMTARSSLPSLPADAVYTSASYMDYGYSPGDIIWNEGRTATQGGVTPPLGWRCVDSDPPGVFEEIPFPAAGTIADNAVTNAKLADMAQATLKGRASGAGTGDPQDLTPAQARTAIASDTNNGALFLAGDGTFKATPTAASWTVDYTSNRAGYYNLTPANMTHVVFNTSNDGFHRVFLQNVATGTRVKLSRLRGGQTVDIVASDLGQTLSRATGSTGNPKIKPGGTVFLTKVGTNLWVGEGDFES